MHERVARGDAEEVHEPLGGGPDDAADAGAADVGLEDGEVDVGVGVGGVEEAAAGDGVGRAPEAKDPVDVEEVGEEGAVLVVALAGAGGHEDGDERGELGVDGREVAAEERARGGEDRLERVVRRWASAVADAGRHFDR